MTENEFEEKWQKIFEIAGHEISVSACADDGDCFTVRSMSTPRLALEMITSLLAIIGIRHGVDIMADAAGKALVKAQKEIRDKSHQHILEEQGAKT